MSTDTEAVKYKATDFKSSAEPRWCPGCEDYAILKAVQTAMAQIGRPSNEHAVVSGIGCSSRFPYYMGTYGFHTIHGRPLPVATGLKVSNPELAVWVVTGDGDGISIGGNHLMHALRRNTDMTILLFDNRIYGLTKGQCSPTSEKGKINKTAPYGTIEEPSDPLGLAVECGASFIAQISATYVKELVSVLVEAYNHKGTSFIEIYQNCNIFNDGAFSSLTDRDTKSDTVLLLEDGQPMVFGAEKNKGIRLDGNIPKVFEFGDKLNIDDALVHDKKDYVIASLLANMTYNPDFPDPLGVFYAIDMPTYEDLIVDQINDAIKKKPKGSVQQLLDSGDNWVVK